MPRSSSRQVDMLVSWTELPRTTLAGHAFYDKLQAVLIASDFDGFVERACASSMRRGAVIADPGYRGALPDEQGQPGSASPNSNCRRR